jgi:hypothetical protein
MSLFPDYSTPAADAAASSAHRSAHRSDDALLPVPQLLPGAFLPPLDSLFSPTAPANSQDSRTFDDLTPDELWRLGAQFAEDVQLSSTDLLFAQYEQLYRNGNLPPAPYHLYHQQHHPEDQHTAPPVLSNNRRNRVAVARSTRRSQPYHLQQQQQTSQLTGAFGHLLSLVSPTTPAAAAVADYYALPAPLSAPLPLPNHVHHHPADEHTHVSSVTSTTASSAAHSAPAAATTTTAMVDNAAVTASDADGSLYCHWYDCPQRGLPFTQLGELAAHLTRHVPHRRSLYPCLWSGCPRGTTHPFPKRHKLIAHLRSHTLERPYTCSVCNRSFAREDSRDAHMRVHAEERVGPWGCGCQGGRVWRSWRGVRRHQASGGCQGVARIADVHAALAHQPADDDDDDASTEADDDMDDVKIKTEL